MKLAFVLFEYFPFGGLQRDCLKTAQRCAERGHAVTIYTREWQGERPTAIDLKFLVGRGWSNIARDRNFARAFAEELATTRFEGVVGFNKLPGLDVYFGADPCYVAKAARLKPLWHRLTPRYRHFARMERAVFARGQKTQVLVLTEEEVPRYEAIYKTERERFHLLPPGIERRTFSPEQKRSARQRLREGNGWAGDERLLLFVGSGFRVKGLDRAITAFSRMAHVQSTRLVVIGQNSPGEFIRLAEQLNVSERVHFLGGRKDVFDWMLAADLLIHPARNEAAGMVLLEALTAGLPVLTTDACGYAFHIERANAGKVLESPFTQYECDLALKRMLSSTQMAEWSANGLSYAAHTDLYSCHERAVAVIEGVLARLPTPCR